MCLYSQYSGATDSMLKRRLDLAHQEERDGQGFLQQFHSNLKTNISAPSRSTQTPMQCSLWRRKGTSSRWKKRNGKNIFLPQNRQNYCCRWTRWSPPGRWSPSTLRLRECPTSSMSTGPTFYRHSSMSVSKNFVTCHQQTGTGVSPLWRWSPPTGVCEVHPALSRFYIF